MDRKIIEIINEWNPIEIYPLLEDEYISESKEIIKVMRNSSSIEELSVNIYKIFKKSFGKKFTHSIDNCEIIAKKIMNI